MNVKPIIFSGPMVRAILEGRKTQTRRVYKDQAAFEGKEEIVRRWPNQKSVGYAPGDILWVREQWRIPAMDDFYSPSEVAAMSMSIDAGYSSPWSAIEYCADGTRANWNRYYGDPGRNRASMHMPRWASRITLEVTEVRVQRLQEISCADAIAEGIRPAANSHTIDCDTPDPRHEFRDLWNSINAKRGFGWDANPWVAAVTFKVHNVNVDEFLKAREAA
jgi:hypothetical protein